MVFLSASMRGAITNSLLSKYFRSTSFSRNVISLFHCQPPEIPLVKPSTCANFYLLSPPFFHFVIPTQWFFLRPVQTLSNYSMQSLLKSKLVDHEKDIDSNTTIEELKTAIEALQASLDEDDLRLGLACLKVGQHMYMNACNELEEALSFAIKALEILGRKEGGILQLVKALHLVGSISYKMKKYDASLDSLETAYQILGDSKEEGLVGGQFDSERISILLELSNTKAAMGRRWEALSNLQKSLDMHLLILEPDSLELGRACKDVAEAYAGVLEFDKALPLCLKALNIFEAKLGKDCEEVLQIRQLLGAIYIGLGENDKALVQNELCRELLQSLDLETKLLDMEIEAANIQISLGRLDEAISSLKSVILKAVRGSDTRALAFVSMAKALLNQERFGDAKGCLDMSVDILNMVESTSSGKVEALLEVSMLYEMMNEFETAISLMKKALSLLEKVPEEQQLLGSVFARMGWLLLLTGRVQHAVPSLETALEKLKDSFGPKHFGLGFVYKHLGQAYLEMEKRELALQMFLLAKEIMDTSFGPNHEDSIDTCQCIANAYGMIQSYEPAMQFQQEVIDRWETHGPDARDELRESVRLLHQLKKKAQGSPSAVFPANCLPQPLQK
ncbi:hypothetical protein HPP92_013000 [Vanilla planifolia]|uniref:Uncharacterized protein n=1 Tax=Vanilla planifolia TaxID=51239 RepID=A0A835QU39_VANPL|nr:hypothetical protein HPP92_013000 [Vanilla planifolia]